MKKGFKIITLTMLLLGQKLASGQDSPFVTTWSTTTEPETISIPLNGDLTYDFDYVWKNAADSSEVTSGIHTSADGAFDTDLPTAGDYLLEITGDFPHFQGYPKANLTDINQWGDIVWESMFQTFNEWPGVAFSAEDNPDLSQVTDMSQMFFQAGSFNDDISDWNVSNVTNMGVLFRQATAFNQPLNTWDVGKVTNMNSMFRNADNFNQDLNNWDVSGVTNMRDMFLNDGSFNGNISLWNVANVTDMQGMFANALVFNSNLNEWNVGEVRNMRAMFRGATAFNSDISSWNVGKVTNMREMFSNASNFNSDIGGWNVSKVQNMNQLFRNANNFNADISRWNVGNVGDMNSMFRGTSMFNQDIGDWNVSSATNMSNMFSSASVFNKNLGRWDIRGVVNMQNIFNNSALSPQNYDQTLIGWAPQVDDTTPNLTLGASGLTFCTSEIARQSLLDNGWTINDSGNKVCLDETDVVSFKISELQATDEVINTSDHTITLSVIQSADITTLTPTMELSPGATVVPESNVIQNFTNPVTYTVTAEDGTTPQDWIVTITQETVALTGTDILSFDLAEDSPGLDQVVSTELDDVNQTITLNLIPFGVLTNVTPEITISQGATVNPLSGASIDLSTGSATYTVTAEDGTTSQNWTVSTNVLPSKETDITAFTISGQIGETEINSATHEISILYPFALGLSSLTPAIALSQEATINPQSGVAQDFTLSGTNSAAYTVTAQDGNTAQLWTVTLIPASEETDILTFNLEETPEEDQLDNVEIDIDTHVITLNLIPFGSLTTITPNIGLSDGANISPENFQEVDISLGSVSYTVTAEDGITSQEWTVNTNLLLSEETDFISFEIPGQVGGSFIDSSNHTIFTFFSEGTDLTSRIPTFELSREATSAPASGEAQNFTSDITYTVTAQDGIATQEWVVSAIAQRPFITTWSSSDGNLSIGLNSELDYDFKYTWKNSDGQIIAFGQHTSADGNFVTNLPTGEFSLEILGNFPHFTNYPTDQLLNVTQWGNIIWRSFSESFRDWTGTDFGATDAPDLSQGPDMFRAFSDNPNFNADLSDWDMSQVTTLQGLFNTCPSFNSDISQWSVGNVTNMESAFNNSGFNGDISGWNVSNVARMVNTFRDASNFDQDLSSWNIGNVNNMSNMLNGSGMSIQNYDQFLISIAGQTVQSGVTLGAAGIAHCLGVDAVNTLTNDNGWTIDDEGQLCSSENDILTFKIEGIQVGDETIDELAHTVSLSILSSAALNGITPTITASTGASISPASGEIQNFTEPVVYEVLSSDGAAQQWTVTVTNSAAALTDTDILTFNPQDDQVEETTIDEVNHSITLKLVPDGSISAITPEITISQGASISPASGQTLNLSAGSATYNVTAEDGTTTQEWTISVILSDNTDILDFDLTSTFFSTQIDTENHAIDFVVVEGTDVSSLLTEVTVAEGASISPQAITVQDFTNPITYTVTAADGVTTQEWVVSVETMRPFITTWDDDDMDVSINNDFTNNFSFQIKDESGEVRQTGTRVNGNGVIDANFSLSGNITLEIIGSFPHLTGYEKGNLVDVNQWGDIEWRSFENTFRDWDGVDFSAEDTPDLSQVESMRTMFRLASSFNGDVSDWDVSNVVDIAGVFNEASSFAGDVSQWQVDNVTDMQGVFRGTLFNGDLSEWNVSNVTNMASMFTDATLFNQDLSSWNIAQVTSMTGFISGSGMSVQNYDKFLISIATQTVQPNVTLEATDIGHCFAADAVTALTADNGWTINDEGAVCSSENDMLTLDIPEVQLEDEIIDVVTHTVNVTVINSADLSTLSPIITLSNNATFAAGSPKSSVVTDFTSPVTYEILSSDSTFQTWTVTVVKAATPLTDTDILTFVPSVGSNVSIDTEAHEITFDAVITPDFLVSPEFTLSQGAISTPASGEEVDLTDGTETYTVTAEDGTTQDWTVTVNDLKPANDLCSNAIAISVGDVILGNTTLATSDASIAPDCGSNSTGIGVWYSIIGNGETITLNTCTGDRFDFDDTSLSVFTGSCNEGLSCLAGNEDAEIIGECGPNGFQASLKFNTVIDQEYLILVDGFAAFRGEFELTVSSEPTPEAPVNDDCETAETLTVFAANEGSSINGSNINATAFDGTVECDFFANINDVWYEFNSGDSRVIDIVLELTDTDGAGELPAAEFIKMEIHEGCGGRQVLCDEDDLFEVDQDQARDTLRFFTEPNTDYKIQLWNSLTTEGSFTIQVNEAPNTPATLSLTGGEDNTEISRFSEQGLLITQVFASDTEDDEQVFSIFSGNDEGVFEIDPATGEITIADASALQASASTAFDLTFQAADQGPGALTSEITLTINIIENAAPVLDVALFSIDENSGAGTVVGIAEFSDPNGDEVSIISFNSTNGVFSVNPVTGEIQVATESLLDFETNDSFSLTIVAEDDNVISLRTTATITINLNDVNEAPVVSEANFTTSDQSPNGTIVGSVLLEDQDTGQTHSYAITSSDADDIFTIDENSGEVFIANATLLASNGTESYVLSVEVSDNGDPVLSGSNSVGINVVSNNPPEISTNTLAVNENSPGGTLVGSIEASDADDDQIAFSLANTESADDFLITQDGQLFVRDGAVLNFESTPQINLEVAATDDGPGTLQIAKTIAIQLNNVNESLQLANVSFDISTQFENGSVIGTIEVEDPDSEAFTFAILTGNDEGIFALDEISGVLSLVDRDLFDPVNTPRYTLIVSASDGEFTDEAQVTIDVFANPDLPVFTSANTFAINENNESEALVGTVVATDGDGISDYDIVSGDDDELFFITNSGELRTDGVVLNFEETQQYILEVRADDDGIGNLSSTQQITININDVNEFDPIIANTEGSAIPENSSAGTVVGTVDASDEDFFQTLSYEITGGNETDNFAIDQNGQITTLVGLDFEDVNTFNLTITVSDDVEPVRTTSQEVIVAITDVNETPVIEAIEDQNGSIGGEISFTVTANDPENDELTFSFADGTQVEGMEINSETGVFIWTPATDQSGSFETIINVTDGEFTASETISFKILNSETDILTFVLNEQTRDAVINTTDHTIEIEVTRGSDVSALIPTITISEEASISPAIGVVTDYTNAVIYTVTAQDGTTQDWTVTVREAPNTETDILAFVLSEQTGAAIINATDHTVVIEVAFGTEVTALTPTITFSEGATSNPSGGAALDFTNPATITVTAEDGTTVQEWTATVTVDTEEPDTDTDILTFVLAEQTEAAVINTTDHTVSIEVAFGTNVNALAPTITLSEGATSDPASGTIVDFTNDVTYTVTAEDGVTTQNWSVTITVGDEALSTETEILSFVLDEQTGPAVINNTNHTVAIEVAFGTDVTVLSPVITLSEGAKINPESGAIVDFTNTVTYTITAEDGSTLQEWEITVTEDGELPDTDTDILTFALTEQTSEATINTTDHTVAIEVTFGTDVTALITTFTLSEGATSNPVSGEAVDFTNSVTYSVTAEDETTIQDWVITVTVEEEVLSDETDILSFILTSQTGSATINATTHTIVIEVAFGTDVTSLIPTFTLSEGAISNPESGTAVNFTNPIAYLITAEDGVTIQAWVITVLEEDRPLSVDRAAELRVYPNPVQDILYVKTQEEVQITLTDLTGRSVISKQKGDQFEMNLSHLKNGGYLLIIQYGDQIVSRKIYKRD